MKIVVLGASGQIGSVISRGLAAHHQVTGTSRKGSHGHLKFDPFQDNWSALGKADVLINCIGQIAETGRNSLHRIHVELTRQIIARRHQLGGPTIIQVSALGASPEHRVDFLRTKAIADELLLQQDDTAVIRPSIVCTHETMIVRKVLMLSKLSRLFFGVVPVPRGFLRTRIQPVMPEDLVALVTKMCVHHNYRQVNIVGPDTITFQEIIHTMIESTHQRLRMIEVPKRVSDVVVNNLIGPLFPTVINPQQYQLLFADNIADGRMAEEILGRPTRSTAEFFKAEFSHATD
jgi:nucleoside-diphosphate-sugar epimerase